MADEILENNNDGKHFSGEVVKKKKKGFLF